MFTVGVKLICLFFVNIVIGYEQRGYLITSPTTFLEGSTENVCVSLHNITSPVTVNIALYSANTQQKLLSVSHNIFNNSIGCLELYIPSLNLQEAHLVTQVISKENPEINGNIEKTIIIQNKSLITIIVTDKLMYMPGQTVKFRIFVLSHTLKPHDSILNIWLEDPFSTKMMQWSNMNTQHGLIQLELSLADNAIEGTWSIFVEHIPNSVAEVKQFKVLEFVIPRFEVIVASKSSMSADADRFVWEVCARYSYGRVVKGKALLQIKQMRNSNFIPPEINDSALLNKESGCFNFSIPGSEFNLQPESNTPDSIVLTATVKEENTEVSQSTTITSRFSHAEFYLRFECASFFKPGLPYKGKVLLLKEDKSEVGAGIKIQLCLKVLLKGTTAMTSHGCWSYFSDFGSQVVFTLPFISKPQDIQMIMFVASAPDYPSKYYMNSSQIFMIGPTASQTVRPWFSPSSSYLYASTRSPVHCGTTHMIPVHYTIKNENESIYLFHYLVKSRGDLLVLKTYRPETVVQRYIHEEGFIVKSWRLPLLITPHMAPISKLTIYYFRTDGEVVATTTTLNIESCHPNRVRTLELGIFEYRLMF
uniref:TEP1-F n=1 Tax=Clastoptera arizonana TaxID=38151 RepID=A0A1B6C939_9HEMI